MEIAMLNTATAESLPPWDGDESWPDDADDEVTVSTAQSRTGRDQVQPFLQSLPYDDDALIGIGRRAMHDFHHAIMNCSDAQATKAEAEYRAVIYRMNGDTFDSCYACDDSPGNRLATLLAAAPGEIPIWGQKGEFLVEVANVRAVFKTEGHFNCLGRGALHAVDPGAPFVSGTGYQSALGFSPAGGCTVDQTARMYVHTLLKGQKATVVAPVYRDDFASAFPWLAKVEARSTYVETTGQGAFAF